MISETPSFEELFTEKILNRNNPHKEDCECEVCNKPLQDKEHPEDSNIMTSKAVCSFTDFVAMVQKVVDIGLKDLKVKFEPDENRVPILRPDVEIDTPYITFKINERIPKELKPRIRQNIMESKDKYNEQRFCTVYAQKFSIKVQFDIFATTCKTANEVLDRFEDLMLENTGYFKKNGVSECIFSKQYTDTNYDSYRQNTSVRNIEYIVELEKVTSTLTPKINDVIDKRIQ